MQSIETLSGLERRVDLTVPSAQVDNTLEIMRRQRATYETVTRGAQDGDRVTIDFRGTLDGVAFDGGSSTDFPLVLGQGRMLPEFETALQGMAASESKTFPLTFPADYRATNLAGKAAQFEVSVKKVEEAKLPAIDAQFARSLPSPDFGSRRGVPATRSLLSLTAALNASPTLSLSTSA